ncbi:hypothetical protein [Actinomadura madurae]|uniref:hypothetical protein n=1 Tax=Actinomadura madurae TaxID=1993 RepID=UPI0020D235F3|nr:hypothetical protein [Actinomadura madurae]MCQ0019770.1 hypothetical protein [Actinomadura madurae]
MRAGSPSAGSPGIVSEIQALVVHGRARSRSTTQRTWSWPSRSCSRGQYRPRTTLRVRSCARRTSRARSPCSRRIGSSQLSEATSNSSGGPSMMGPPSSSPASPAVQTCRSTPIHACPHVSQRRTSLSSPAGMSRLLAIRSPARRPDPGITCPPHCRPGNEFPPVSGR